MRKVAVIGVGVHPWGAFEDKSVVDLAVHATTEALKDANLKFRDIQAICAGASIYFPVRERYLKYYSKLDFAKKSKWDELVTAFQKEYDKP